MKKQLLLLVLFMGLFATSYAQDKKMFAGVNLDIASKKDVSSDFGISPKFGYWLSDNSAIVGRVGFASHTDKGATDVVTTAFSIGAQLRYGWHMGDHTFFYLAPGVNFGSVKNDTPNAKATTTFTVDLTPGVDYMLGDSWSINAEIGLLKFVSTSFDGNSNSDFTVHTNMDAISFGLWYHF
jgi:opacity protein-like surface antigen